MVKIDVSRLWNVSRETEAKLRLYQTLLHKWQEKINLISPTTVQNSWERHFVDSLQLLPLLSSDVTTLYDLGSGAGFAGMVLAIARPDIHVILIESDAKKCAFLQTVSRETNTKVAICNERIEKAAQKLPAPNMVSARALTSLPDLLTLCQPWIEQNKGLQAVFPKGVSFQQEIDEAMAQGWLFHVKQTPSLTDPAAQILCLSEITKAQ